MAQRLGSKACWFEWDYIAGGRRRDGYGTGFRTRPKKWPIGKRGKQHKASWIEASDGDPRPVIYLYGDSQLRGLIDGPIRLDDCPVILGVSSTPGGRIRDVASDVASSNPPTLTPDAVFLEAGTNNLSFKFGSTSNTTITQDLKDIHSLITTAKVKFPNSKVVVIGIFPRLDDEGIKVESYNNEFRRACKKHEVGFFDVSNLINKSDKNNWANGDAVHLSDATLMRFLDELIAETFQVIKEKDRQDIPPFSNPVIRRNDYTPPSPSLVLPSTSDERHNSDSTVHTVSPVNHRHYDEKVLINARDTCWIQPRRSFPISRDNSQLRRGERITGPTADKEELIEYNVQPSWFIPKVNRHTGTVRSTKFTRKNHRKKTFRKQNKLSNAEDAENIDMILLELGENFGTTYQPLARETRNEHSLKGGAPGKSKDRRQKTKRSHRKKSAKRKINYDDVRRAISTVISERNRSDLPFDMNFWKDVAKKLSWPVSRNANSIFRLRTIWTENRGNVRSVIPEVDRTATNELRMSKRKRKIKRFSDNWISQTLYCICATKYDKSLQYIECEHCKCWYHYKCVGIPSYVVSDDEVHYVCGINGCNKNVKELWLHGKVPATEITSEVHVNAGLEMLQMEFSTSQEVGESLIRPSDSRHSHISNFNYARRFDDSRETTAPNIPECDRKSASADATSSSSKEPRYSSPSTPTNLQENNTEYGKHDDVSFHSTSEDKCPVSNDHEKSSAFVTSNTDYSPEISPIDQHENDTDYCKNDHFPSYGTTRDKCTMGNDHKHPFFTPENILSHVSDHNHARRFDVSRNTTAPKILGYDRKKANTDPTGSFSQEPNHTIQSTPTKMNENNTADVKHGEVLSHDISEDKWPLSNDHEKFSASVTVNTDYSRETSPIDENKNDTEYCKNDHLLSYSTTGDKCSMGNDQKHLLPPPENILSHVSDYNNARRFGVSRNATAPKIPECDRKGANTDSSRSLTQKPDHSIRSTLSDLQENNTEDGKHDDVSSHGISESKCPVANDHEQLKFSASPTINMDSSRNASPIDQDENDPEYCKNHHFASSDTTGDKFTVENNYKYDRAPDKNDCKAENAAQQKSPKHQQEDETDDRDHDDYCIRDVLCTENDDQETVSKTHITDDDDYCKFGKDSHDNTQVDGECCDQPFALDDLDAGHIPSSTFSDGSSSHVIDAEVSVNTPQKYRTRPSKLNESILNDESYCVTSDTLKSLSSVSETAYHDDNLFIRRLPKRVTFNFPVIEWTRLKKTQKGRCFGRGEWQKSVLNIVKESNPFCSFKFNFHRVSTAIIRKRYDPVFWLTARCQFTDCTCNLKFVVMKSMAGIISYDGVVRHAQDDIQARPIRLSERRDFHQQFSVGALKPMKLQIHNLSSMRGDIYVSGNRDDTGKTRHVYQKLSSESRTVHRMDPNELISLSVLRDKQKKEINEGTRNPGFIQHISLRPLYVISFTDGGLRAWHDICPSDVVFWDATGSCIRSTLTNKRILYYELSVRGVSSGQTTLPVTILVSDDHSVATIKNWLTVFRSAEKTTFGHNRISVPKQINSDRAWVFLIAALDVFNHEDIIKFYARAWRIVTGTATEEDLGKTIPHTCASHLMNNAKRIVKKHYKKYYRLGMYLVSILLNSSTLTYFSSAFKDIAIVLLSPTITKAYTEAIEALEARMKTIGTEEVMLGDENIEDTIEEEAQSLNKTEDEYLTGKGSRFTGHFRSIIAEVNTIIDGETGSNNGSREKNNHFCISFFHQIVRNLLPTSPFWSGLLLGDLSRHKSIQHANTQPNTIARTIGISEQRMGVLKNNQLSGKRHNRLDEFFAVLTKDIIGLERKFRDTIILKRQRRLDPIKSTGNKGNKSLVTIQEEWAKRTPRKQKAPFQNPPKNSVFRKRKVNDSGDPTNPKLKVLKSDSVNHEPILIRSTTKTSQPTTKARQKSQSRGEDPQTEPTMSPYLKSFPSLSSPNVSPPGNNIRFTKMENAHNNCWFNSTMQCMVTCKPFVRFLTSLPTNYNEVLSRLQSRLVDTAFNIIHGKTKLTSATLASVLRLCDQLAGLRYNSQCDPLEFIQKVINPLFRAGDNNPMQITVKNTYTCQTCKKVVTHSDCLSIINLHMDIWDTQLRTISSRLQGYFADEMVEEMPCYSEHCQNSNRSFVNQKTALRLPDLLVVCLARYDQYGQNVKNTHRVPIDIEIGLKQGPSTSDCFLKYSLQSVVQHIGPSTHGGHFTAVCRQENNTFFVIDDTRGYSWDRSFTEKNAYLLFYSKKKQEKLHSHKKIPGPSKPPPEEKVHQNSKPGCKHAPRNLHEEYSEEQSRGPSHNIPDPRDDADIESSYLNIENPDVDSSTSPTIRYDSANLNPISSQERQQRTQALPPQILSEFGNRISCTLTRTNNCRSCKTIQGYLHKVKCVFTLQHVNMSIRKSDVSGIFSYSDNLSRSEGCPCGKSDSSFNVFLSPEIILVQCGSNTGQILPKNISLVESSPVVQILSRTQFYMPKYMINMNDSSLSKTEISFNEHITVTSPSVVVFRKVANTMLTYDSISGGAQMAQFSPLSDLLSSTQQFQTCEEFPHFNLEGIKLCTVDWITQGVRVTVSDRQRLLNDEWLSDTIIESFMLGVLLLDRQNIGFCSSHMGVIMSTSSKVTQEVITREALLTGLKRHNWFIDYEMVLIPNNCHGNHWNLIVLHPTQKHIDVLDSMSNYRKYMEQRVNDVLLIAAVHYLSAFSEQMSFKDWRVSNIPCPQQMDGQNCGVFLLYFARCIVRSDPIKQLDAAALKNYRYFILKELYKRRKTSALSEPTTST